MNNWIIKFRAWDKELKKWLYNVLINGEGMLCQNECRTYKRVDVVEIQQFTGLHDKNGKEIYEGDIVMDAGGWKYEITFGKIGYDNRWNGLTGFSFKKYQENEKDFMELHYHDDPKSLEVIGNIHENPELLK